MKKTNYTKFDSKEEENEEDNYIKTEGINEESNITKLDGDRNNNKEAKQDDIEEEEEMMNERNNINTNSNNTNNNFIESFSHISIISILITDIIILLFVK